MTKPEIEELSKEVNEIIKDDTSDWNHVYAKINLHPEVKKKLLSTSEKELRKKGFIIFAMIYHYLIGE